MIVATVNRLRSMFVNIAKLISVTAYARPVRKNSIGNYTKKAGKNIVSGSALFFHETKKITPDLKHR
jgi:hypothetical protein